MSVSLRPLADQVMVITGASSGIGLATARAAAEQGARLVLTSRNAEALEGVVGELEAAGGTAIASPADVGRRDELERVADAAVDRFGRIDAWVNNAGLGMFGRLTETDEADARRLFDTNFWGVVNGSIVAVARLRQAGGALINVGSVVSDVSVPIQGMYAASKHAVKGFTDALRIELHDEGAPISVTLIKPAAIDTPFPQHARNFMAREPKLPPPVYQPEEVAAAILYAAEHPRRDLFVGGGGRMMSVMQTLAPGLMDWVGENLLTRQQQRDESPRNPAGSLRHAGDDGHAHGDHPGHVMTSSLYTRASIHPVLTGAVLATVGFAAAATWLHRERL